MNSIQQVKNQSDKENLRQFSEEEIEGFLEADKLSLDDSRKLSKFLKRKTKEGK